MLVTLIAGARPNFMKIAPIIRAIKAAEVAGKDMHYRLVHTGQHYDKNMSDTFFEELGIPAPDVNLGCGGGTQAGRALGHILKRIIVEDKRTFTTEIRNQVRHYQWQPNEEDDQVMHVPVWVRGER